MTDNVVFIGLEMPTIPEIVPNHNHLLSLEPEEVAGVFLEYLNTSPPDPSNQQMKFDYIHPR